MRMEDAVSGRSVPPPSVRKRRRPPVISETPPSDDDDVECTGVVLSGREHPFVSIRDSRPEVAEDGDVTFEGTPSRALSTSLGDVRSEDQEAASRHPAKRTKHHVSRGSVFLAHGTHAAESSASLADELKESTCITPRPRTRRGLQSQQVPLTRRVRLRTPRGPDSGETSIGSTAKKKSCERDARCASPPTRIDDNSEDQADDRQSGVESVRNKSRLSGELACESPVNALEDVSQRGGSVAAVDKLRRESVCTSRLISAGFTIPNCTPEDAFSFVLAEIGGRPAEADVKRLRRGRPPPRPASPDSSVQFSGRSEVRSDSDGAGDEATVALVENVCDREVPCPDPEPLRSRGSPYRTRARDRLSFSGAGEATLGDESSFLSFRIPLTVRCVRPWFEKSLIVDRSEVYIIGNELDDERCEASIEDSFWLFAANRVNGVADMGRRMEDSARRIALARQGCHLLVSSRMLNTAFGPRLIDHSSVSSRAVVGFCWRLIELKPPRDVTLVVIDQLLRIRNIQTESFGFDSLSCFLSSREVTSGTELHYALAHLWLAVLQHCDAPSNSFSFWSLFNELLPKHKEFVQQDGRATEKSAGTLRLSKRVQAKTWQTLSAWESWCFDALSTFGSLYRVNISRDVPEDSTSQHSVPRKVVANWPIVMSLFADLQACVDSSDSLDVNGALAQRMAVVFRRTAYDAAARLWTLSEEIVLSAVNLIHSLLLKSGRVCSCSGSPSFLCQLRSPIDVCQRESFLESQLASPCDYVCLLSWMLVAESPQSSGKAAGKVVREASKFHTMASKLGETVEAFRHSVSLTLAVADGISAPSVEHGESLFCSLLSSKSPPLAVVSSRGFGMLEKSRWDTVLDAVSLRCKLLLRRGERVLLYIDELGAAFVSAVRSTESPSNLLNDSISKREAMRLQHRLLQEVTLRILATTRSVIDMMYDRLSERDVSVAIPADMFFDELDSALSSLARFVRHCGAKFQRALSQLRSSQDTSAAHVSFVTSTVLLIDSALNLCTLIDSRGQSQRSSRSRAVSKSRLQYKGLFVFLRTVLSAPAAGLVDVIGCPGTFGDAKASFELKRTASGVLGRLVGLTSFYADGLNQDQVKGCQDLSLDPTLLIRRAGMDFGATVGRTLRQCAQDRTCPEGGRERAESAKISLNWPLRRTCALEFWSVIMDSMWIDSLLDDNPEMERMIVSAWILLLVGPEIIASACGLLKFAWALKTACRTRPFLAQFFAHTSLSKRMEGSAAHAALWLIQLQAVTLADAVAVVVKPNVYPEERLHVLLECICDTASTGEECSKVVEDPRSYDGDSLALTAYQRLCFQRLFMCDLQSLVFVIQGFLHNKSWFRRIDPRFIPGTHQNIPVRMKSAKLDIEVASRRSLEAINDSICRAQETASQISSTCARAGTREDCHCCPKPGPMYDRVVACVLNGLAFVGYDVRAVELKVRVARFAKAVADSGFDTVLYERNHMDMPLFHSLLLSSDVPQNLATSERNPGVQWRRHILHALIESPLTCSAFGSLTFHAALKRLLTLVCVLEKSGASAMELSDDLKLSLSRLSASLPERRAGTSNAGSVKLCCSIGLKVEELVCCAPLPNESDASAYRQALLGLATALVGQASDLLEIDSPM